MAEASILYRMLPFVEKLAQELEDANKLKAIEIYLDIQFSNKRPITKKTPEIMDFLKKVAEIEW